MKRKLQGRFPIDRNPSLSLIWSPRSTSSIGPNPFAALTTIIAHLSPDKPDKFVSFRGERIWTTGHGGGEGSDPLHWEWGTRASEKQVD